jgi:diguanylate cyclase (GGDEF)-like protein/PAS domain S-box-containing protein
MRPKSIRKPAAPTGRVEPARRAGASAALAAAALADANGNEAAATLAAGEAQQSARTDDARIGRLFEMTSDLLAMVSMDGRLTLVNPAWEQTLGWSTQELMSKPLIEFVHPDDVDQTLVCMLSGSHREAELENFTNRIRHQAGEWRSFAWSGRCDGKVWYLAARDVSERASLELQALHDPLTKLPNRLLLMDRARQAIARLQRSDGLVALIFIDLDRFKLANDRYGHEVGDRLLTAVSERLSEMMRDSDTVARLGGDEFVILAEELESEAEALALAERVLRSLESPIPVGRTEVAMPASVGIAIANDQTADAETMLREADVAMYRAKNAGGHRLELFDESLRAEATAQLEIEERLLHALPRKELRLTYQPIIPLAGGRAVGCEALLRWHPGQSEGATIEELLPSTFLPRAAESDLILQIGDWVLQAACAQAAAWRRAGLSIPVSVNISERELVDVDIAARVSAALARFRLPGPALCLEVSEEAVVNDLDRVSEALASVRRLGVATALDNFGRVESSFSLARSVPLDMLKLDRGLIETFDRDRKTRALVAATIALAKEAGMKAVAVGLETPRQVALARELGCTIGQGFVLHRPEVPGRVRLTGALADVTSAPWRPRVRLGQGARRS